MVRAIKLDKTRLIIGGNFRKVQGKKRLPSRPRSAPRPESLGKWAPNVNRAVTPSPSARQRIYLGGEFTAVNGKTERHLAALNRVDRRAD